LVERTLDELLSLLVDGRIDPLVDARPFTDVPKALDDLANRRTDGKVVIEMRNQE